MAEIFTGDPEGAKGSEWDRSQQCIGLRLGDRETMEVGLGARG